jgi:glyoxylase-like metal-dependent hydrolase (beta-lactamase superfamily II)
MCPRGARMLTGEGGLLATARLVCHCLLIEGAEGLVLVDTGFGLDDIRNPRQLGRAFTAIVRPQLNGAEAAIAQLRELGFDPRAAMSPSWRDRPRYVAAHWAHGPRWVEHDAGGEPWHGFESVRILPGSDAEILLIPLYGHSHGHTGVAVRQGDGWLLHCGDSYFHHGEVATPPHCPRGIAAFAAFDQVDGAARHGNVERLRELALRHSDEVELICSHDPVYLDGRQAQAAPAAAQHAH